MTTTLSVGTKVNVVPKYNDHEGMDLYVLYKDNLGYGIGPKGNDPDKHHNPEKGWLYYRPESVTPAPIKESNTVTKFNVGDKVKVLHYSTSTTGSPVGETGTVTSLKNGANFFRVQINKSSWLLAEDEIEPFTEPKPFSFEGIQVGDTIRRTETWETGSVKVLEGVVTALSHTGASTKEGLLIGWHKDSDNPHITLELLNRPEPVKEPELWEDRKTGDRIVTYFKDGALDRIFTKQEDGLWGTLVSKSGSGLGKGFARSDTELAKFLSDRKQSTTAQLIK